MFRKLGGWKFDDVTNASGTGDPGSKTIGAVALDYDGDGKTDLYVANDQWRNTLFHNEGGGVFRDVSDETGTGYPAGGQRHGVRPADAQRNGARRRRTSTATGGPTSTSRTTRTSRTRSTATSRGAVFAESDREAFGGDHDPGPAAVEVGRRRARLRQRRQGRPRGLERPDPLALLHGDRRRGSTRRRRTSASGKRATRRGSSSSATRARPGDDEVPRRLGGVGDLGPALRRRARPLGRRTSTATGRTTSSTTRSTLPRSSCATRRRRGNAIEILPVAGADRRTVLGTRVTGGERRSRSSTSSPSYASGSWLPLHFGLGTAASAHVVGEMAGRRVAGPRGRPEGRVEAAEGRRARAAAGAPLARPQRRTGQVQTRTVFPAA